MPGRFTAKQLAAQRKFAAAARRYGGRIPRGAKMSTRRSSTVRRSSAKRAPRKAAAPKQRGWFETDRYGWSDARRAAGRLWLPAAQRNRDPNSTVEYGPSITAEQLAELRAQSGDSSVMFGPDISAEQLAEVRGNLEYYAPSTEAREVKYISKALPASAPKKSLPALPPKKGSAVENRN